ncbi:hypothetical protein E2C01_015462 [Portunus trituberculatus]|uniref:Uncharacterized protein n=1 Tax=Portunus trituberculatus TaxID=210409 RepID=A0A5B7DMU6_PORTR|nr:hypothetical protein [Portunus trituberculatus]
MPPGSPGTYRKKSSSLELPAALQQLPRTHRPSLCDTKMAEDKPWPNTKEDYDLREVIGLQACYSDHGDLIHADLSVKPCSVTYRAGKRRELSGKEKKNESYRVFSQSDHPR